MENIDRYAKVFDESFPDYADARYGEIKRLVEVYDSVDVGAFVNSDEVSRFMSLIKPIIAIKNYKSQIPFPEDLLSVIRCISSVRLTRPLLMTAHRTQFDELLSLQGFQLPTASAILHFCHPNHFPIVDVNVEAACSYLQDKYAQDFNGIASPSLPAPNTSSNNKAKKYLEFIMFINRIKELQSSYGTPSDFRYIDKALMVIGVPKFRNEALHSPTRHST